MRTCDEILDYISARLDGELNSEQERELAEHLEACPACRALADDLAGIHAAMPGMNVEPPAFLIEHVMERIRAETPAPIPFPVKKAHNRHWRAWGATAAALILVAAGVFTLRGGVGSGSGTPMLLDAAPSSVPTANDAARAAALPVPQPEGGAEPSEPALKVQSEEVAPVEPINEPAPSAHDEQEGQGDAGSAPENDSKTARDAPVYYTRTPPAEADVQPSETPAATPAETPPQAPMTFQTTVGDLPDDDTPGAEPIPRLTVVGAAEKLYREKFAALYPDFDVNDMVMKSDGIMAYRFPDAMLEYAGENTEETAYLFDYTVSGEVSARYLVPMDGGEIQTLDSDNAE